MADSSAAVGYGTICRFFARNGFSRKKRTARPVRKRLLRGVLAGLRLRIRSRGRAPAKMRSPHPVPHAEHRPGDPRQLAGKRPHDLVLVSASEQGSQPLSHRSRTRRERRQGRPCAVDQERTQEGVALLGIPRSRGSPPVVTCRGTRRSQAARSGADRNVSPRPIAATNAVAFIAPKPGIVVTVEPPDRLALEPRTGP